MATFEPLRFKKEYSPKPKSEKLQLPRNTSPRVDFPGTSQQPQQQNSKSGNQSDPYPDVITSPDGLQKSPIDDPKSSNSSEGILSPTGSLDQYYSYYGNNVNRTQKFRALPERTIVLDIDRTLIYTPVVVKSERNPGNTKEKELYEAIYNFRIQYPKYRNVFKYTNFKSGSSIVHAWVMPRPYLDEYLRFIGAYFDHVAIWSAGIRDYIKPIVDLIFQNQNYRPEIMWCRKECRTYRGDFTKPLINITRSKGWEFSNTILIDDASKNFHFNKLTHDKTKNRGLLAEEFFPLDTTFAQNSSYEDLITKAVQRFQNDNYLLRQIQFLRDVLAENDHSHTPLSELINNYKFPTKLSWDRLREYVRELENNTKKTYKNVPSSPLAAVS